MSDQQRVRNSREAQNDHFETRMYPVFRQESGLGTRNLSKPVSMLYLVALLSGLSLLRKSKREDSES